MANHYADYNSVRKYIGVDDDDVTDNDLKFYIEGADSIVFQSVALQVIEGELSGKIDGVSTTFNTEYYYIADTDYDCLVDSDEVTVYAWGTYRSLDTRKTWGVSSINATEGKVYLSSAPPASYDALTIDYYHYKHKPNYHMLRRAANFYAAYDFIFAEYLLIPVSQRHGAISWRHAKPYQDLWDRYQEAINLFNQTPYSKKKQDDIKMGEKYLSEY